MKCANCGRDFEDTLEECPHCHGGRDVADWPARMRKKFTDRETPAGEPPPTNLVLAILTALCCCMPLGVVAIVYAAMAEGNVGSGDYAAARRNAAQASNYITWGVILGILGCVAAVVLSIAGQR